VSNPAFLQNLEALNAEHLAPLVAAGRASLTMVPSAAPGASADATRMLQVALANEISVSELAAAWMPTTPEIDVKLAFARQAGDEAGHFQLVADRLSALGFDLAGFQPPGDNPLFQYLKGLSGTVARIAAGLFALESIAYAVNESFMAYCDRQGDAETVRIYREFIQPDELAHGQLGRRLLAKHATTPDLQSVARDTVTRVLAIAGATRAKAAERLGAACFPGC
jgi:hypothetical protein